MAWNSYPKSALVVDAIWNVSTQSSTSYALQYELRRTGYYTTAYLLDGKFGVASIKAWQRYMRDKGTYEGKYTGAIDGSVGAMTRNAAYSFNGPDGANRYNSPQFNFDTNPSIGYFPAYDITEGWQKFLNWRR